MLRTLFVLSIIIPGLVAALLDPFAGLVLYVWYALFRPEGFVYFDLASYRVSLVFGAVLLLRSAVGGILPSVRHPIALGILLFLAAACVSQFNAVDQAAGWSGLIEFATLATVALLTISLVSTPFRLIVLVAVLAGSFGFHSSKAGLGSLLGGGVHYFEGLSGAFGDNNGYALGVVLVLPLLAATGQILRQRWLRWGFYLAVPLSAFAVVSLFSRGGLLGLASATVTFASLQRRKFTTFAGLAVVGTLLYFVVPLPPGYLDRIATIGAAPQVVDEDSDSRDESTAGRVHFWNVAILMTEAQPLGVGLRNYEARYDAFDTSAGRFGHRRAVHSSYFQVLAETGVDGALIYLTLLGYAIWTAMRVRRRALASECPKELQRSLFAIANGTIASMAGFAVGGAFLTAALNDVTWLTFALIAALDQISLQLCSATGPASGKESASPPALLKPSSAAWP